MKKKEKNKKRSKVGYQQSYSLQHLNVLASISEE
jgi:hypothetical protein